MNDTNQTEPQNAQSNNAVTYEPTDQELTEKAKTSLILGIIGLIAWLLPLAGYPITIVGIVKASKSLKCSKSGMATAGLVLSIIGLVLTVINF